MKQNSRGDTTPSVASSPLLAVVAQVKRRAPAAREHDDTPSASTLPSDTSPSVVARTTGGALSPRRRAHVGHSSSSGSAAASPVQHGSRATDAHSGTIAAKLLQPCSQQLVATKRARKRKSDFLRQATSGLGAAPIRPALSSQPRPVSARQGSGRHHMKHEKGFETSSSDDENGPGRSCLSAEHPRSSLPRTSGQSVRQHAQPTTERRATRPGETKRVSDAARPAAASKNTSHPAGENHRFYLNARKSAPNGEFIDQMHAEWGTQYAKLEKHHSYIQWLFPVFENAGVNRKAHPLSKREAKAMREDPVIARRIVTSYQMMLRFYGFVLVDEVTGEVRKSEAWQPRFRNFNAHTHNNLRISRILVSLGELGFKRYKAPLLEALRVEIFENNQLQACRASYINFWQGLVTDEGKPWYVRKTLETRDADRTESVFFVTASRHGTNDHRVMVPLTDKNRTGAINTAAVSNRHTATRTKGVQKYASESVVD